MPDAIMTLGAGHSIISIKPKEVSIDRFQEAITKNIDNLDTLSLGLFTGQNYNTFYPELDASQIQPKDDEFITPVYRLLSEVIISKYYPTDFSKPGVLKNSMGLLVGQTINCDHESDVANAIGSVKSTFWQEAYKLPNGKVVPAGINGQMLIDAKSNPRIARGILMDPPSIHSNSVTVSFAWEKSHPEMSDSEFYQALGSYNSKGELVRRVVSEIYGYSETSLVSNGADPFAKLMKDGRIVLPDIAARKYDKQLGLSEQPVMKHHAVFVDFKKPTLSLSADSTLSLMAGHNENENIFTNNNKDTKTMNELQEFLATLFGDGLLTLSEGEAPSGELVVNQIKKSLADNITLKESLQAKETEVENLQNEVTSLKEETEKNKAIIAFGNESLTSLRSTTLENYRKLFDKEDEVIVNLINTGDTKSVNSLNKAYTAQLEEKFPLSCKACGSHDVNRGSSNPDGEGETKNLETPKDNASLINTIREKKFNQK